MDKYTSNNNYTNEEAFGDGISPYQQEIAGCGYARGIEDADRNISKLKKKLKKQKKKRKYDNYWKRKQEKKYQKLKQRLRTLKESREMLCHNYDLQTQELSRQKERLTFLLLQYCPRRDEILENLIEDILKREIFPKNKLPIDLQVGEWREKS